MASRVRTAAVVAGLVAFGATEGRDANAQEPQRAPSEATPGPAATHGKAPKRTRKTASKAPRASANIGLVATLPGFEILPDGGSRLFVELTHSATVTEKRDARSLTYVIKGAHVRLRNNENALVTVHFNTPVVRARLLPFHGDLIFSVELRADTAATWRLTDATEGGGSVLQIDFPKGSFLPAGEYDPTLSVDGEGIALAPEGARIPGPQVRAAAPSSPPPPAPGPAGPTP